MLRLVELHEASLLFCLKKRYFKDIVYTNIGPIVVALNPFTKEIPWYKDEKMQARYRELIERQDAITWVSDETDAWQALLRGADRPDPPRS